MAVALTALLGTLGRALTSRTAMVGGAGLGAGSLLGGGVGGGNGSRRLLGGEVVGRGRRLILIQTEGGIVAVRTASRSRRRYAPRKSHMDKMMEMAMMKNLMKD